MSNGHDRNYTLAKSLRKNVLNMVDAPYREGSGYTERALTQVGQAIGENLATQEGTHTMGGSTGRTEEPFQAQRAGEREAMSQFGDDKEKMSAAMARSMMGSKKFTKGEIRRGYRKLKG